MLDEVEHCIHGWYMAVRAVVGRTVAYDSPRLEYAGEIFVLHADGRVGLVVFQQYVVTGFVFLDKIVLQQQGILFRVDHDIPDICNLAHQYTRFSRFMFSVEVGRDPALQVFCFPYVYNRSLGIQILVNTGTFGKVQNDTLQVIICF